MAIRIIVYLLFLISALLITLFGIGPVIFTDGSTDESIKTLAVVFILYLIWGALFLLWVTKRLRKKRGKEKR